MKNLIVSLAVLLALSVHATNSVTMTFIGAAGTPGGNATNIYLGPGAHVSIVTNGPGSWTISADDQTNGFAPGGASYDTNAFLWPVAVLAQGGWPTQWPYAAITNQPVIPSTNNFTDASITNGFIKLSDVPASEPTTNASQLTTGTLDDARLSTNIFRLNYDYVLDRTLVLSNPANVYYGSLNGAATSAAKATNGAPGGNIATNIIFIWAETNQGLNVAGAGYDAANGNYIVVKTNYLGNIPFTWFTNTLLNGFSINTLQGYYGLLDPGGGEAYNDGYVDEPVTNWVTSDTGTNPAPTVTLTNIITRHTNFIPANVFSSSNSLWIDPKGNDALATALGGHSPIYPFASPDYVLQGHSLPGDVIVFYPGIYQMNLWNTVSNQTVIATGSTIHFGTLCCTVAFGASANAEFYGGSYIGTDAGETQWRWVGISNLLMDGVTIKTASSGATDGTQVYDKAQTFRFIRDDFTLRTASGLIFNGNPGQTNLLISFDFCKFSNYNFTNGTGIAEVTNAAYSMLTFQNCIARINNCSFEHGSNLMVGPTNSCFIRVGTNAHVYLGANSFDRACSMGLVESNILYISTNSIPVVILDTQ